ncbi:MAG: T9SS type A sorting domain-containing protein [Ignavibacteriaceae bacterium]|nr:T9SS type A sorting domain-containing protein [Ignavibacteriaceae bacterium]
MKKFLVLIAAFVLVGFGSSLAQDSVDVTFRVNMSVKIKETYFNPATEVVTVPGGFNNWLNEPPANNTKTMSDADGDSIYTKTYKVAKNTTYEYKYNIGLGWEGKDEQIGGNRSVAVGTTDLVLPVVWFNNDSIVTLVGNGNILFKVDMSVMSEVGIFDVVNDSLQVRGSFNGWSDGDPLRSKMFQDPLDANKFFLNVPFTNVGLNEDQAYKFYVDLANPGIWTDGWERPNSQGGGNRNVLFLGQPNQEANDAYYDDISPEWVIEDGKNLSVTFRVNMQPATAPPTNFNAATDTVWWICEQPSFTRSQGWTDTDEMKVLQLTDPESDLIYTGTLQVADPSFNSFQYRYAFKNTSGWSFEPAGFGDFAYRVRYIGQSAPRTFPVNPWTMPVDTWTNSEVKPDQETDPYTSLDVEDNTLALDKFDLSQNYPNPFNPATIIRFNVPETQLVSLKVYDVLGNEVAILVDREMSAGQYEYYFSAANLSTGVYFYTLTAGDFTVTKKMMLIK